MWQAANNLQDWIQNFIRESNAIEGIYRDPTMEEMLATENFLELDQITIEDVQDFVSACQPDAVLRDKKGLNVYVGDHKPPLGGGKIRESLKSFVARVNEVGAIDFARILLGDKAAQFTKYASDIAMDPYLAHIEYEKLHPFTDCNGRSGRVIWLWQMLKLKRGLAPLGFLQTWYYNSLSNERRKNDK